MEDRNELEKVYADYYPQVTATVRKQLGCDIDVDDIVGSIFLDLCEEVLLGRFKHNCSMPTLLFVITRRRIADRLRERYKQQKVWSRGVLEVQSENIPCFSKDTMYQRAGTIFFQALGSQTGRDQKLVLDYYESSLPRIELAEKYNLSMSRVNSILARFIRILGVLGRDKSA